MNPNETPRTPEIKSETIRLPASVFRFLKGPDRHDTIEAMRKSGCRYEQWPPGLRAEGSVIIEASTQELVEGGKKILNDLAARLRAEENAPARYSRFVGQPARNNQLRTHKLVTEKHYMPAKRAAFNFGYRNDRIKKISSDTGATIKAGYFRINGVMNVDVTTFTVTGTREKVTKCLQVIKSMEISFAAI